MSEIPVLASNNKNNSSEAERKQLRVNWTSNLPDDVLKFILTRLNWGDRIRLCGVSKNFLRLSHQIPSRPMERLPWLIITTFYKETQPSLMSSSSVLSDPSSNLTYNMEIDERFREHMLQKCSCYSRHGWLVSWQSKCGYHYFSLYRPYNKKLVVLPEVPYHRYSVGGGVTLSMDLTSLDYLFFYVRVDKSMLTLDISMCHIGDNDNNWSTLKFDLPADQNAPKLEDVICEDGFLYCVLDGGNQLGILDVAKQEWNFFTDCMELPPEHLKMRAAEALFNGDLFLLHWKWFGGELAYFWRFDKVLKQWVRQESLGNMALFIGWPSFLVETEGELSPYANTIHHVLRGRIKFASFYGKSAAGALYPLQRDNFQEHSFQCWIEPPMMSPN